MLPVEEITKNFDAKMKEKRAELKQAEEEEARRKAEAERTYTRREAGVEAE